MDPTYPLVPIANFLACVLVLLPLFCTSIRSGSWNIAVTMFALWTAAGSIITGVDAIIWSDNVKNVAPVWCDITTSIDSANTIALRACTFLITRSLYNITHCEGNNSRTKRNKVIFDLMWTVGLPLSTMLLYYVVRSRRFEIIEEEGCNTVVVSSGLWIILFDGSTLILPIISGLFYCPRIICAVCKRRRELTEVTTSDPMIIFGDVYQRVMILGCVDALLTLPLSILQLVIDLSPPPTSFYPGWSKAHANFSVIAVEPANIWKEDLWETVSIEHNLWITPFTAFAFFALFGLTKEAREVYRSFFWKTLRPLGLEESSHKDPEFSNIRFGSAADRNATVSNSLHTRPTCSGTGELSQSETSEIRSTRVFSLSPVTEEGPTTSNGEHLDGDDRYYPRKEGVLLINSSVIQPL